MRIASDMTPQRLARLLDTTTDDAHVAETLGVSRRTVARWRQRLGDPCTSCRRNLAYTASGVCRPCRAAALLEHQRRRAHDSRTGLAQAMTGRALPVRRAGDWKQDAACTGMDTEEFYPVGHGPEAKAQAEAVKAVCARCPVRATCLAWALEHSEHGVFGGATEDERKAMKRKSQRDRSRARTAA